MNDWLQKEYVLRIISIILAIMLWFVVNQPTFSFMPEKETTRIQDVYVEAKYDTSQYSLVNMDNKVELILSGNKYTLDHLLPTYQVYVDLHDLETGKHTVPIQITGLPAGVSAEANPKEIEVQLEEKWQKEMDVEVDIQGELPDGYQIQKTEVNPKKVWIKGNRSTIEKVKSVKAILPASTLTESANQRVSLQAYGDKQRLKGVSISPKEVDVQVAVSIPSKKVPLRIPISKQPPNGYRVEKMEIRPSQITVYGNSSYLKTLSTYQGPSIDLSQVTNEKLFRLPISPHGQAIKVTPQSIEVYVKMVPVDPNQSSNQNSNANMENSTKPTTIKEMKRTISIHIYGRRADMNTTIVSPQTKTLTVTIRGRPEALQNVSSQNLTAFIDVSGLAEGTHRIPIQVRIPPHTQLVSQNAKEAIVQLKKEEDEDVSNPEPAPTPEPEPDPDLDDDSDSSSDSSQESSSEPSENQLACQGVRCGRNTDDIS